MSVTNVPSEVWIQTFGYLSKGDLKAVRLSGSHYLGSLASSLLFTTAYVAARKAVLNTFVALTTHPEFCNYVKEIVYDSSYISSEVLGRNKNQKCGSSLATLFEEQEDIHGGQLQIALDKAFRSLLNVTRVHYADMSRVVTLPGDCDGSSWGRHDYQDEPLMYRIDSRSLKSYDVNHYLNPYVACTGHEDNDKIEMKYGGFVVLMQALSSSAATEVSTLSLGQRKHAAGAGGMSYWFFSPINAEITHPYLRPVFSSLRKLDLTVSSDSPMTSGRACLDFDVDLAKLLCSAQNLEEVKLAGDCLTYSLLFANTFSSHTWSKLRAVDLEFFKGSQDELEDFVQRHVTSLRHMSVDYFIFTSGSLINLGAVVASVAPDLELTWGILYLVDRPFSNVFYPLTAKEFDESGLKIKDKGRGEDKDRDDNLTEPEDDSECDSESDRLSYSSDDSTPSTASNPRRKPDLDILPTLTPAVREKVEYIRNALPGCPVQSCCDMLMTTFGDREAARKKLFRRFRYTKLECLVSRSFFVFGLKTAAFSWDIGCYADYETTYRNLKNVLK